MSKNKGKRAEREFAKWIMDNLGNNARRGCQNRGGTDSPDVIVDNLPIHFEVKHVERLNLYEAMAQAVRDAGYNIPVVAHRRNRTGWLLTLHAEDLLSLAVTIVENAKCLDEDH